MRWMYAAYKKGIFPIKEGLGPAEFNDEFIRSAKFYSGLWVQFAPTKHGDSAVGLIGGHKFMGHWVLSDFIVFPWASVRNQAETLVKFLNVFRKRANAIITVPKGRQKIFEFTSRHGVTRRAGTWFDWYGTEPAAIFQTRSII